MWLKEIIDKRHIVIAINIGLIIQLISSITENKILFIIAWVILIPSAVGFWIVATKADKKKSLWFAAIGTIILIILIVLIRIGII
jgi:hypothetical protein